MKINIYYKNRKLDVNVCRTGFFRRGIGLMFRTRETGNLLFDFPSEGRAAITSWFVFFPFLAVWLDANNRVVETRVVRPFKLSVVPEKPFKTLVEMPINAKNKPLVRFLVGKRN